MIFNNRKYKDTVFRELYKDKQNLLELYNAVNNTNYDNPDDLIVKTLGGNTYLKVKNDASFILDYELNLYEHQGTPCANIPLRMLFYVTETLREMVSLEETYKKTIFRIPLPKFAVFYNGVDAMPERLTYKLSDMFEKQALEPELELKVTVYNINDGNNKALLAAANTLREYSLFVSKVRKWIEIEREKYQKSLEREEITDDENGYNAYIRVAVTSAIEECIREDILRDFFLKHKEEAIDMSIEEYSFEKQFKVIREDGYENGYNDAKAEDEATIAEKDAEIAKLKSIIAQHNQ